MIDMFRSRRTYNERCRWWSRDEREDYEKDSNIEYPDSTQTIVGNSDEQVFNRPPSGYFYAKEISSESHSDLIVAGVYRIDRTIVTIESPDDLSGIKQNDIVEYQGQLWMVQNFQVKKFRIQSSEFASDENCSHNWYISLRR